MSKLNGISYPEHRDNESDAEYWERVRYLGLPYPWEKDELIIILWRKVNELEERLANLESCHP